MRHTLAALFAFFIALALPVQEAEAKRFGGGKSSGMQRDALPQRPAAPQRNADQPNQAANPAAPAPAGAANAAGKRNWLGPVAGLAAGLGLAALASHLGLGEEFANLLLIALLVMAGLFLFRLLTRSRAQPSSAMQYAGAGPTQTIPPRMSQPAPSVLAGSPGDLGRPAASTATLPAGFDAAAFTRQAKLNFLRLQAANDAGNLDDIREFTSPEMYAEISLQLAERQGDSQRTEVLDLEAEVLECVEEPNRLVVSVGFRGQIREEPDAPAQPLDEVWHLTRPARGDQGWVVAGIQQRQ